MNQYGLSISYLLIIENYVFKALSTFSKRRSKPSIFIDSPEGLRHLFARFSPARIKAFSLSEIPFSSSLRSSAADKRASFSSEGHARVISLPKTPVSYTHLRAHET